MKLRYLFIFVLLFSIVGVASAQTTVGNWQKHGDDNNNGYPDVGVVVSGHYTSVYAYDASGAYYWDLGDGRIYTSTGINSIDDLDQATLSTCDYVVNYRGTFEDNPFMDTGWIMNNINCYGYDGNSHFMYLIVHESDPRYTGNPDHAIWGTWEYVVNAQSGVGNIVRPMNAVGS